MSGLCQFWAVILHAFVGAVCIVLPFAAHVTALLIVTLLLSFWSTYRAYHQTRTGLISAQLRADNSWLLFTRSREAILAQHAQSLFVTPNIMILILRGPHGQRWMLSVATDNATPDVRRRLYVRLKYPLAKEI